MLKNNFRMRKNGGGMRAKLPHQICALLVLMVGTSSTIADSQIKMSRSGICHEQNSPYYTKIKKFTGFVGLEECLSAGGRLPKIQKSASSHSETDVKGGDYKREYFEHWIDANGDCINTRHELLMEQSISTVDTGSNRCTATRGRWNDPYTGKILYNARDLDIDHIIPLKWAWDHGANDWRPDKRKLFANDGANLLAVKASVNREKGAKGALDWLPPDKEFHCQYVTRWKRIIIKYKLVLSSQEQQDFDQLYHHKCHKRSGHKE